MRETQDLWTIKKVLDAAVTYLRDRGVDSARLDAELLLAHALACGRIDLYLRFEQPLGEQERGLFRDLLRRRGAGREPVAYLIGRRAFYERDFYVEPGVLVPRPETELLVERALAWLQDRPAVSCLELCVGSGCVSISLLKASPGLRFVAVDLSAQALHVAHNNAREAGVEDRLHLFRGDLTQALGDARFDLVVANPPYVSEVEWQHLAPEIREHEPKMALVCEENGLAILRRIAQWLEHGLGTHGLAVIECADQRAQETRKLFREAMPPGFSVELALDLGGLPRAVVVAG